MTKTQNLEDLLNQRFSSQTSHVKVKALAKESNDGVRSSFGGLFRALELTDSEKTNLEDLLNKFSLESETDISKDFQELAQITSEVRAINNQAAMLHGERIMRAQKILKNYREGAFTAWLLAAYGNRQTPYNFLVYFEFFQNLPHELKPKAEAMPRQAVYVLATRNVPFEDKKAVVSSYSGQTKRQMLELIRDSFPLPEKDKRQTSCGEKIVHDLKAILHLYEKGHKSITKQEKSTIAGVLSAFLSKL